MITECELKAYLKGLAYSTIGKYYLLCFFNKSTFFFNRILCTVSGYFSQSKKIKSIIISKTINYTNNYRSPWNNLYTKRLAKMHTKGHKQKIIFKLG